MTFEEAIELLKKAVKESNIKNQPHIDLSLVNADDRPSYEKALVIANAEVLKGTLTKTELISKLGLK